MLSEVIVGAVSGVAVVVVAAFSYLQAKRLKFFETFFQRKADTFEKYITAISFVPRTEEELYALSSVSRTAMLYCFKRSKTLIETLLDLMIKAFQRRKDGEMPEEIQAEFRTLRSTVIASLRSEIQQSKKFKYD